MKLASCKSALTAPPHPSRWFTLLTILRQGGGPGVCLTLSCFLIFSTRRFAVCLSVCHFVLVFFSPFSILITSLGELGKRELILVFFVRLFDLCLFGFIGFLFLLGSGKSCVL